MGAPSGEPRCGRCGTAFLVFREGIPCPRCASPASGTSRIIEAVLQAREDHVRAFGSPVPPTFEVRNLWDDYLYRGLFFLRAYDDRGTRETAQAVIDRVVRVPPGPSAQGWRSHYVEFYQELLRTRRRGSEREK